MQSWLTAGRDEDAGASELARAWGGLMPKPSTACPAATEDASRAVAGHVARCRWTARANPFVRWHIRGRGWTWAESRINITYSQRSPRYVQGGYDVISREVSRWGCGDGDSVQYAFLGARTTLLGDPVVSLSGGPSAGAAGQDCRNDAVGLPITALITGLR